MHRTLSLIIVGAALLIPVFGVEAAPPNKCVVNGKTIYQQEVCPSGQVHPSPTVQELNAQEKKRRVSLPEPTDKVSPTLSTIPSSFRCDGRKHCSQMTSCAEAKYFLANCPGAKVDGDRDGIPCEEQWCQR